MFEINNAKVTYMLWSTLSGVISFLISGIITCIIVLRLNNYILGTLIAGGIGGLLLSICLIKRQKIGKMIIAGVIAVPVGFWGSFFLGYVISEIPYIANSDVPNIVAIILMGAIVGALFGAMIYGPKAIWLFAVVGGVVSFPFGVLVGALNAGHWIKSWLENLLAVFGKIDLNLLAIIMSFGIGIGLSIGLYEWLKAKNNVPHFEDGNGQEI